MALMKLTRLRIAVFVVCAVLPTLFLLPLEAFKLSPHSFLLPSFRKPASTKEAVLSDPSPSTTIRITNNNATYPRRTLQGTHAEYVLQARAQLQRIEANAGVLFRGEEWWNKWQMEQLVTYLRRAETEVDYVPPKVVLTSWHWVPCVYGDCTTGEVQWARPLIEIMKAHNIIYLFSPGWQTFKADFATLGNDLITHIWADDEQVVWCYNDKKCLQSDQNPDGVPPWKLFAFTFWGSMPNSLKWDSPSVPWSFNPLGSEWNLVPYQMPEKQFFLGYYYQGCQALEYIPHEEREDRILILAKLSNYFHNFPAFKPDTFYADLKNYTNYELVSTADKEKGFAIPDGLTSLGLLPKDEYDHLLANAKALLGIGKPIISPTPYASLCRGVPVVLPYHSDVVLRHNNKTCDARPDPTEWCGFMEEAHQHGPASAIGPPYVYAVDVKSPIEDILKVIDTAINTPIQPYVPPEMRPEAVEARLLDYFAIDWEAFAKERMSERGLRGYWELELPNFLKEWTKTHPDTFTH